LTVKMVHPTLVEKLREQVGHELSASHQYMAVATYFANLSLDGWAQLFFEQSDEERGHARKIIDFLHDAGHTARYDQISAASVTYDSALEVLETCLSWEKLVTKQFQDMAKLCMNEGDFTTFQFIQWFISEQVEEERKLQDLIALVSSGINLFHAQALLPKEG